MMGFYDILNGFPQWEWAGMLLARIAVGVLFALSGKDKLFNPEKRAAMLKEVTAAGIPAPATSALMLSAFELIFGIFLVVGFLTPLSTLVLAGIMVGALATTVIPGMKAKAGLAWWGEFFYLPEVLYLVMLVWLFLSGAGRASVDHLIR